MNHLGACNSDAIDLSDGPVCRRDSPVEGLSDTVLQLEIDKADLEDRVKDATKLLTSLNVRSLMDGHELALATEQDPYSDTHFASTFPPLKNQYHETPQASTLREVRSVANLHAHKCGSVRIIAGMVPIFDWWHSVPLSLHCVTRGLSRTYWAIPSTMPVAGCWVCIQTCQSPKYFLSGWSTESLSWHLQQGQLVAIIGTRKSQHCNLSSHKHLLHRSLSALFCISSTSFYLLISLSVWAPSSCMSCFPKRALLIKL